MTVKEFLPFIEDNIHVVIFKPGITKESLFAQLDNWKYDDYDDFVESIDCETKNIAYSFYTPYKPFTMYCENVDLYKKCLWYNITKIDTQDDVVFLFTETDWRARTPSVDYKKIKRGARIVLKEDKLPSHEETATIVKVEIVPDYHNTKCYEDWRELYCTIEDDNGNKGWIDGLDIARIL